MTLVFPAPSLAKSTASGLEGVIAAETVLSEVDGAKGQLVLRGKAIEDLAGKLTFEEAIAFFWDGLIGTETSLEDRLRQGRLKAFALMPVLEAAPRDLPVYQRMRLGLSALADMQSEEDAAAICAALPVFLAASARIQAGLKPVAPDVSLTISQDILQMLTGRKPVERAANALDRYLVTILDHGLNASTFTARVIASTKADMASAIIGAMSALKGPLHGGAPGPVLDMLDAVGTSENADNWVAGELKNGIRLMGFGHRIYRTRDPRADVLKAGLAELQREDGRIALAEAVETAALAALRRHKPDRLLETNVEFYTAVLLEAAGIDRSLFTPLFAVGRSVGWCAHVVEQQQTGKLIRPASRYTGPMPQI